MCLQTTVLCIAEIIPVQDVPFPLKPVLHVQVKLPILFVQSALASQLLPPPGAHSLVSNDQYYVNTQYYVLTCVHKQQLCIPPKSYQCKMFHHH